MSKNITCDMCHSRDAEWHHTAYMVDNGDMREISTAAMCSACDAKMQEKAELFQRTMGKKMGISFVRTKMHKPGEIGQCDVCKESFDQDTMFQVRMASPTSDGIKWVTLDMCASCKEQFRQRAREAGHERTAADVRGGKIVRESFRRSNSELDASPPKPGEVWH